MPLPPQVQAQLAQADATLAALNTPPQVPPVPEPPPPPPPPPAPTAAPATPPAPVPAAPAPVAQDTWEQRYRTLQGIHRGQKDQLDALQREMAALRHQVSAPPAPAPTAPPKPVADPKDVEAFGLDMVSMVQRTTEQYLDGARQAIESRFAQLEQHLVELQRALGGTTKTVQLTAEQQFFKSLTEQVPEWQQINGLQEFLDYLAQPDPLYGFPRQAALDDAQQKWDAHRAANVFKAFIATLPAPPAQPPMESPSPRGAGSPPPPPSDQKPVYSQAQVAKFYDDVRRGHYRGNPAEHQRLEALYNAAMAEGRIR